MLRTTLIDDSNSLQSIVSAWDELATRARLPYSAPGWMLSWWRNAAPPHAQLRAAAVFEDDALIGIAPFFVEHRPGDLIQCRLLGAGKGMRLEPVAVPDRIEEIATHFAALIDGSSPKVDLVTFEGLPAESPWPELFAQVWPGKRPWVHQGHRMPAPTVSLEGKTFEEWFSAKSRNFRQQMKRARRQLETEGATIKMVETFDDLEPEIDAFARLHYSRWEDRGGSKVLSKDVERMLLDVAHHLLDEGRFRLWTIRIGDRWISSHLFLAAGGEVSYWLGGFDDAWATRHPSMVTILAAIEHAFQVGDRRFDLGGGGRPYKYRFADGEDTLVWTTLAPHKARYPLTRLQLLPKQMSEALARNLSPEVKAKIKNALGAFR